MIAYGTKKRTTTIKAAVKWISSEEKGVIVLIALTFIKSVSAEILSLDIAYNTLTFITKNVNSVLRIQFY